MREVLSGRRKEKLIKEVDKKYYHVVLIIDALFIHQRCVKRASKVCQRGDKSVSVFSPILIYLSFTL